MNMRETRRNELGVVSFCVNVHYGCTCVLCMIRALINSERERMVEQQERTGGWKSWEKRKEGEKWFEGKVSFFVLCDCVFHSFRSPFQSTMPPLLFLCRLSLTPHTTLHNHKHAHVCSSWCETVYAFTALNQTTQHHAIMQSPHMAQPMDDAMSEWERAVVIEDTTPQTPSTIMKWWWHPLHFVSLVAWIVHAHSLRHNKNKGDVTWK